MCGLIVPANTVRPSLSFERAKILASSSVTNVFVSRRLRCLGRMPRLRISNVTYQIGLAAPVNVIPRTARPVAWCERLDPGKTRHSRISCMRRQNGSRFIDVNQGELIESWRGCRRYSRPPGNCCCRAGGRDWLRPPSARVICWRGTAALSFLSAPRATILSASTSKAVAVL